MLATRTNQTKPKQNAFSEAKKAQAAEEQREDQERQERRRGHTRTHSVVAANTAGMAGDVRRPGRAASAEDMSAALRGVGAYAAQYAYLAQASKRWAACERE